MEIKDFGITLRLVEIQDADFILELRNDNNKSRYISATSNDVLLQKEWLKKYKEREKEGKEYYFIALDENNNRFATYRIYNIQSDNVEIGSWISASNINKIINPIKVDFLVKRFVFNELDYSKLCFEVRKANRSVINYHKKYDAKVIKEDDLNYYFELSKLDFYNNKDKFEKMFNKK